jgi:hypothetical protein
MHMTSVAEVGRTGFQSTSLAASCLVAAGSSYGAAQGASLERQSLAGLRKESMQKAFVTSIDARFLPGAVAVLRGVQRFHPDVHRYCFVTEDAVDQARQVLGGLAEVLVPSRVRGVPDEKQTLAARLYAARLPADVVLFCDADACINRPIPEFWVMEPGRVNVVYDASNNISDNLPAEAKPMLFNVFPHLRGAKGFNAGVFALRPADWSDLPERFEAALQQAAFPYYPPMADQPILNGLLLPHANILPDKFNAHVLGVRGIPRDVRITHFTGPEKPWYESFPKHEPAYYYWLKNGVFEDRASVLMQARLRILLHTPRRLIMRRKIGRTVKRLLAGRLQRVAAPLT